MKEEIQTDVIMRNLNDSYEAFEHFLMIGIRKWFNKASTNKYCPQANP